MALNPQPNIRLSLLVILLLCTPSVLLAFLTPTLRPSTLQRKAPPSALRRLPFQATPPSSSDDAAASEQQPSEEDFASPSLQEVDMTTCLWPKESRQLLGLLGALGFAETAYLTYYKVVTDDLTSLCTAVAGLSMKCGDVLNSEYASFFGVPLTLPAMVAYGAVATLAVRPLLAAEGSRERAEADLSSRDPLLLLTTAMATFSVYLMWVLATQLHELCPYCLVSAALSFSMATLTWSKSIVPDATKAAIYKGGAIVVTGMFSVVAFIYASARVLVMTQGISTGAGGNTPPPITTHSDARTEALASRLAGMDAKMYGAFWCSHCYEQKQSFGREAYSKISYIECAPDGLNSQTKVCKARKVPGYPTWEIKGELYPGEKTIEQLEDIADGKVAPPPPLVIPSAATANEGGGP